MEISYDICLNWYEALISVLDGNFCNHHKLIVFSFRCISSKYIEVELRFLCVFHNAIEYIDILIDGLVQEIGSCVTRGAFQ